MRPLTHHHRDFPHPLLDSRSPTLYAQKVPVAVEWDQLVKIFEICGPIYQEAHVSRGGLRSRPARQDKSRNWTIHFDDVIDAERALATLNGLTIKNCNPKWKLYLSHSPAHASPHPAERTCPLFPWSTVGAPLHPLVTNVSAQEAFDIFRNVGPLVSVRVGIEVGLEQPTTVLEFWYPEHAEHAKHFGKNLREALNKFEPFNLRSYDPCTLVCCNLPTDIRHDEVKQMCSRYGQVERININAGTMFFGSTVHVTYRCRSQAAKALRNLKRESIDGTTPSVRYFDPSEEHPRVREHVEQRPTYQTSADCAIYSDAHATAEEGHEIQTEDVAEAGLPQRLQNAQNRREKAQRLFDEARGAEQEASQRREELLRMQNGTAQAHMRAALSKQRAENEFKVFAAACDEAKKGWIAMMDEAGRAKRKLIAIDMSASRARDADEAVTTEAAKARREELRLHALTLEAERELREAKAAQEAILVEEFAELAQRMEELNLQDEKDGRGDRGGRGASADEDRSLRAPMRP